MMCLGHVWNSYKRSCLLSSEQMVSYQKFILFKKVCYNRSVQNIFGELLPICFLVLCFTLSISILFKLCASRLDLLSDYRNIFRMQFTSIISLDVKWDEWYLEQHKVMAGHILQRLFKLSHLRRHRERLRLGSFCSASKDQCSYSYMSTCHCYTL